MKLYSDVITRHHFTGVSLVPCLELEIQRESGYTPLYPCCITKRYMFKALKDMILMLVVGEM